MYQGTIVDDIDNQNSTHEMLSVLTSLNHRTTDDMEGFGRLDDRRYSPYGGNFVGLPLGVAADGSKTYPGIPPISANAPSFRHI